MKTATAVSERDFEVSFDSDGRSWTAGKGVEAGENVVAFEIEDKHPFLKLSQVLDPLTLRRGVEVLWSGKALITGLTETCSGTTCEVKCGPSSIPEHLSRWENFVARHERTQHLDRDYRAVVDKMSGFLSELFAWTAEMEFKFAGVPLPEQEARKKEFLKESSLGLVPLLNSLFEEFEAAACRVPAAVRPSHAAYMRKHLHSYFLLAPFAARTFRKPLGYAGDFETVRMINDVNSHQGNSLFAKLLNHWFWQQPPAEAHRNRLAYLVGRIETALLAGLHQGKRVRVLSVGCGPALEIQKVMQSPLADQLDVSLLDFDRTCLAHVERQTALIKHRLGRSSRIKTLALSVQQLLKGSLGKNSEQPFDLIYCAGLFDYLPDRTCRSLVAALAEHLAPKGSIVITNVDYSNPLRFGMEDLLDWYLIYRRSTGVSNLRPEGAGLEEVSVVADLTGVNLICEFQKH